MIQESIREMTADERASLQSALRPEPARRRQPLITTEGWVSVGVVALTLAVIALAGGRNVGGFALAIAAGVVYGGYRFAVAARGRARREQFREQFIDRYTAQRQGELAAMLQDGRVTVKRVRAVAVVQIEPIEDEGTGYVFDLGDGRVLFLKGQDYDMARADDASWPNTDFEIVRAVTDGTMLDLHCHGAPLPPLRVVSGDDVDPQKGWDERDEVLEMSMDDAVRTILREH
jgi:hypothetical protein